MRTLILALSLMFFVLGGAAGANEIIFKDCYNTHFDTRFDNKTYSFNYYNVDQKNKTITQVWAYTDEAWNNKYKYEKGSIRNAVNVYKLEYIDKNFAKGSSISMYSKSDTDITIDLKTKIITTTFAFDKPVRVYTQCK